MSVAVLCPKSLEQIEFVSHVQTSFPDKEVPMQYCKTAGVPANLKTDCFSERGIESSCYGQNNFTNRQRFTLQISSGHMHSLSAFFTYNGKDIQITLVVVKLVVL